MDRDLLRLPPKKLIAKQGKATVTKVGGVTKAQAPGPASHSLELEQVAKSGPMTNSGRERTYNKPPRVRGTSGRSWTYYPYIDPEPPN